MDAYIPLLVYLPLALLIPIAISVLASRVNRVRPTARQGRNKAAESQRFLPYESGRPTPPLAGRFSVKFYLVAMLFVIFDVEVASFFPWAVLLDRLGAFGLWEIAVFTFVLGIGYAYVWKRGGFQWR